MKESLADEWNLFVAGFTLLENLGPWFKEKFNKSVFSQVAYFF